MKDLRYYTSISTKTNDDDLLSLIEPDISGGKISKETIDTIADYPNKRIILISGLRQDTFDYFIQEYGHQFDAINFWKCPMVEDLSKLELLTDVKYISYFWNQRAEKLWNFSKNIKLLGFSFYDFTRMHTLTDICKSRSIRELYFGNKVWSKYIVESLAPLSKCESLMNLSFSAKKILDDRIESLASIPNLKKIDFPIRLFTTEQIAWLKAHMHEGVEAGILNPIVNIGKPLLINGKNKDTYVVGKGKPFLSSKDNADKITQYKNDFFDMYEWFKSNPSASPEDYKPF